ncbi:MAG: Carboxymuconolactone decarboxylase family protein [Actinomycetia bacterium]|jgi:AhpD family alkylhydroperoxidase|nr:Carboxymuconolactone decarboxylase family protein [Actinomycetes bacterium]
MTMFTQHTIESAPAASRRSMTAVTAKQGYLPAAVGLLAESPEALESFLRLSATFDACTLDPLAREVVIMTVAVRNGCHLCVAMHAARLAALGADPAVAAALRTGAALKEGRLDAVRAFTLRVLDTAGEAGEESLAGFLGHGFTRRNALEIVLGIGAYTLSTLANRLTGAPVDEELRAFA